MAAKKVTRSTGKTKTTVHKYKASHKRASPNEDEDCHQEINLANNAGHSIKHRCENCGANKDFAFERTITIEFEEKTGR